MSTLVTNKIKKELRLKADIWLYISLFVCLFGRIYEHYSHEVYSYNMMYAFAYALVFGCVVRIILIKNPLKLMPGYLTNGIYNCGVATIVLGKLVHGVIQIYGAASDYTKYYYIVGAILIVVAVLMFIVGILLNPEEE